MLDILNWGVTHPLAGIILILVAVGVFEEVCSTIVRVTKKDK